MFLCILYPGCLCLKGGECIYYSLLLFFKRFKKGTIRKKELGNRLIYWIMCLCMERQYMRQKQKLIIGMIIFTLQHSVNAFMKDFLYFIKQSSGIVLQRSWRASKALFILDVGCLLLHFQSGWFHAASVSRSGLWGDQSLDRSCCHLETSQMVLRCGSMSDATFLSL